MAFIPIIAVLQRFHILSWKLLFVLVLFVGICNFVCYFLAAREKFSVSLKWTQLSVDLLLWTALIKISGEIHSIFYLGYVLEMLLCSITLSIRGCVYAGVMSGILYSLVILHPNPGAHVSELIPRLLFLLAVCLVSVVLIRKFVRVNEQITSLNEKLTEEVAKAKALSAVGIEAASVAHDIRNQISGIKGFFYLLSRSKCASTSEDMKILSNLEQGVDNLERILDDILLYAEDSKLKARPIDLRIIVESALTFLPPEASKYSIAKKLGDDPVFIRADAEKLRRCILNLALNAMEASDPGGAITVSTSAQNGDAVFKIRDAGGGIPQDVQDKVFTPFFSTKDKGVGLGLAITKNLVKLHRGEITFTSEPGRGTEFAMRFPLVREAVPH